MVTSLLDASGHFFCPGFYRESPNPQESHQHPNNDNIFYLSDVEQGDCPSVKGYREGVEVLSASSFSCPHFAVSSEMFRTMIYPVSDEELRNIMQNSPDAKNRDELTFKQWVELVSSNGKHLSHPSS